MAQGQRFRPTESIEQLSLNGGSNKIRHGDNERADIIHCQVTEELRNEVYWP